MEYFLNSPKLKLVVVLILTILIGVLSSVFVTEITHDGKIEWSRTTTVLSFWLLFLVSIFWIGLQVAYLNHEQNILRFSDDQHCLAYIRKTKLDGYATQIKNDPSSVNLMDVGALMKELKVKSK